jgi:hypothetical protein
VIEGLALQLHHVFPVKCKLLTYMPSSLCTCLAHSPVRHQPSLRAAADAGRLWQGLKAALIHPAITEEVAPFAGMRRRARGSLMNLSSAYHNMRADAPQLHHGLIATREAKESLGEFVDKLKESDEAALFGFIGH